MKKKTKVKIILIVVIALIALFLYFSGTYESLKIKAINYFENTLQKKGLELVKGSGSLIDKAKLSSLEDSGIKGENLSFNAVDNPYYEIIDENEKRLYKQIYANIEQVEKNFKPVININKDSLNDVVEAVYNDHPELFYVNTSYSYKYIEGGKVVQITLSYNSTAKNLDKSKSLFENNVNQIIANANNYSTAYEKEKYVHDYLIEFNKYDEGEKLNQSAYSAIVTGKTVCAGYSRAFQYIMNRLGVATYYVTGDSDGDHAWNIIELDGECYNVDITWDDQSKISYRYFNVPDSVFSKTHIRKSLSIYLPVCRGTKYYNYESKNNTKSTNKRVIEQYLPPETEDEEEIVEPKVEKEDKEEEETVDEDIYNKFKNYYNNIDENGFVEE